MFSGIIDHCGKLLVSEKIPSGLRLRIRSRFKDFERGESIAVDGVCLTVVESEDSDFICEVSRETLACTTLGEREPHSTLNLERSLSVGDRLGGHFVSGHVDEVVKVSAITQHDDFREMKFSGFSENGWSFLVQKGSVAINGVSLTLNQRAEGEIAVMLIPHTLERTNLGLIQVGSSVNIEYDLLVRAVIQRLNENVMESILEGKNV